MKATFVFADDSKISVNAFNSVKAKLAHLSRPPIKVFFDIEVIPWELGQLEGFEGFQERDKQARIKWINDCADAIDNNVKGLDKLEKSLSDVEVVNPTFEQPIIGDNGPTLKPLTEAKLQPSTLTPQQQSEFLLLQIEGKTIECNSNLNIEELRDCYDGPGRIIPPGPKEIGKPGQYIGTKAESFLPISIESDKSPTLKPPIEWNEPAVPRHVLQVFVVDYYARLLIIHRSNNVKSARNVWSIPTGTHEIGETAHDCIVRELMEEFNLTIRRTQIIDQYENIAGDPDKPKQYHWVLSLYAAEVHNLDDLVNNEPHLHDDFKILPLSNLRSISLDYLFHHTLGTTLTKNASKYIDALYSFLPPENKIKEILDECARS